MARMRAVILAVLGLVVIAASLRQASVTSGMRPDGTDHVVSLYRAARSSLPARGTVAFIQSTTDSASAAELRFLAQYALVPLVLTSDTTAARVLVTSPQFSDARDETLRAAGWRSTAVSHGGIRIYER